MQTIPVESVSFHPHSFGDPDGRLFWWQGELYRGIAPGRADFYRRLLANGAFARLIRDGWFVETAPAPLELDGFGLVVRHRQVPFVSYPNEWCPLMFQEAVRALLRFGRELAVAGLTLKDHHLWNLTYDFCRPVYLDLTSIVPLTAPRSWPDPDKFRRYCLYPLQLMADGQERIARLLLPEYGGVREAEFAAFARRRLPSRPCAPRAALRRLLGRRQDVVSAQCAYLKEWERQVEAAVLPATVGEVPSLEPRQERVVRELLAETRPSSLLVVGRQVGAHALVAGGSGCPVVAFDADSAASAALFARARAANLRVLPLVMDFTRTTPAVGFGGHFFRAASERLRCEWVLAPSLVNEMVERFHCTCEQIADGLSAFAARGALVQLAPVGSHEPSRLERALRSQFPQVTAVPVPTDNGLWWRCQKAA